MTQLEKLIQKILNNPKQVKFKDLDKLLFASGFKRRQGRGGSSHYFYKKGSLTISIPYRRPHILPTYVFQALELMGLYNEKEDK